jgi:YHS domain-containing protein
MKMRNLLPLGIVVFASVLTASPADDTKKAAPAKEAVAKEVKDPVCGMTVDPKTSEKASYKGKTYYFCSKEDKEAFEKTPDQYTASASQSKKK